MHIDSIPGFALSNLRRPLRAAALMGVSALALSLSEAQAQSPRGGTVVKGSASISQTTAKSTITQTSKRAVIDWQGFDVGADHSVHFDQPGRSSSTLNRVNSADSSLIEGAVTAPGTVVIQNTAGVYFSKSAKVDVGGLVASSQLVDMHHFMETGNLRIGGGEQAGAYVLNEGDITIGEAGLAALVGNDVRNAGAIIANKGTVALASGEQTTIDFTGDGLIQIAVTGESGGGGVTNSGLIDAPDGTVILTAGGASSALDGVINTSGIIRASSASSSGGRITLSGRGKGQVRIAGTVEAKGSKKGGSVDITGETVAVTADANIDASGGIVGGTIRIGGDYQGDGPLRRADHLQVDNGATIAADGGTGTGGTVIAWSDNSTYFDGTITTTGLTGGGLVETSGKEQLGIGPNAQINAGVGGTWLLDPRNVEIVEDGFEIDPIGGTIDPPDTPGRSFQISTGSIVAALNNRSDVTITTNNPNYDDSGRITVYDPILWTGLGDLRLESDGGVRFRAPVTTRDGDLIVNAGGSIKVGRDNSDINGALTSFGTGSITLDAGHSVTLNSNVRALSSGSIDISAERANIKTNRPTGSLLISTSTGDLNIEAEQGSVRLQRDTQSNAAGHNLQVVSRTGDINITAGDDISLIGDRKGGRWVRVRSNSQGDVTLRAGDTITVQGGTRELGGKPGDAFAEVVAGTGGSITMEADHIQIESNESEGRVQAVGGASLTMNANTQNWDGPVNAGLGPQTGGDVEISGEIVATVQPMFSLNEDNHLRFAETSPDGTPSSYTSELDLDIFTSGTGTIEIEAPMEANQITMESERRVGITSTGQVTGHGTDDAVIIAAGQEFRSEAGVDAVTVTDPSARWLIYIDPISGLVVSDGAPGPREPNLYNRPYLITPPYMLTEYGGNRIVFGEQPTLTVRAHDVSKTYGETATLITSTTGLVPGDDLADALTVQPSATSDGQPADAPVNGSPYAIVASAELSDQGYAIELIDGTLTIDPASLTITADDASRSYGADDPAFSATYAGFVNGEDATDLDGTLTFTTDATATSPVGTYGIEASGQTSGNYTITYVDGTLTIDPASLTITADDASRTYGADDPAFSATYAGFVNGEDSSDLDGTLTFTTDATATSPVGTYGIEASGQSSGNYTITYVDGTLTIDPASLTITADDASRTYGADDPAFSATYAGFVNGEDASDLDGTLTFTTDATATSPVGTYGIEASGQSSGNYTITYVDGTLTIDPASLTITADDASRSYGADDPAFSATYAGFVNGEDASDLDGTLTFTTDATATSPVGTYGIEASGQSSGNYTITYVDGTLTIDPASLTITADDASRSYGADDPAFSATYAGFVNGEDATDLDGTLTFTTDATATSPVGTYGIEASGQTSGNYTITYVDGTLTIDPASLTITADDASRTYGADDPAFSATYAGFVNGEDSSDLDGTLTFTTDATATSPVGTYGIEASGQSSGNYTITYVDGTLTIDPASLTITADDASRTYGADDPAFSATYAGFVNGEDASDLDGTLTFTTDATATSPVGTYGIEASGQSSGNYTITYVDGTLTIDPASLTITADDASRSYGADDPAFGATYAGFVNGEDASDLDGTLTFTTGATATSPVGTYGIEASGQSSGNYTITYVDGTLTIDPASLTITADDASRSYGADDPAFSATYAGFVNGEDATDLDGTLTFTTDATATSPVGTYGIEASGQSSGNYTITYVDGTLTIDPASLTITADDASRSYGADDPAFSATYAGFVNGEDASNLDGTLTFTTDATATSPVGTYGIEASGQSSGNYTITYVDGTLTIDPASLTITADDASRTYGADDPAFSATYAGFVNGEDASDLDGTLTFTTDATATSPVGTYGIEASGQSSGNYTITYVDGTLTIDPASLTITADDASRSYGADDPAFGATYAGFVNGEDASDLDGTLTFTTGATATSPVGTYGIEASGQSSGNYTITYVDGTLTIDPASLTITADDASRSYGADDPAFSATYAGFVNGEDATDLDGTLTFTTDATATSPVGTYGIEASGQSSGNYTITYVDGTLTIDPASLTITADDASRSYGADDPAFSATYAGFVNGEDASNLDGTLTFTTDATATSPVGTYGIEASGQSSGNYTITYVDGTLTIDPASLTITADDASRTYGADDPAFSATYAGFVNGEDASDLDGTLTFTTDATATSPVGTYGIEASGQSSGNYTITYVDGTLTIDPASLTITADDASRSYGADDPAFGATYAGFVNGEDASDLDGTLTFTTGATATSPVGTYGIEASGQSSGNYTITYVDGTLEVDPAQLTITADDKSPTYGTADPGLSASYDGFVNGEGPADLDGTLTLTTDATQSSPVGTYDIEASGQTSGNYTITYVDGTLTVDPAQLTITADDANREEGDPNPVFTATYTGLVLGETPDDLNGDLELTTDATQTSAPGDYTITPFGQANDNYVITYVDGTLTVVPAGTGTPDGGGQTAGDIAGPGLEPPVRGVPPLTPGDATFRTTQLDAPPATSNTFDLTYSLGDIVQLAPTGGEATTGGFTPAAGEQGGDDAAQTADCSGPINRGATDDAVCSRQTLTESYWSTTAEDVQ